MPDSSIEFLIQHNNAQLSRLAYLNEYSQNITDSYVKLALIQVIEDIQDAIAGVSSRLRRLDVAPGQALENIDEKLLRQARTRRSLQDRLQFVRQGLKFQIDWYEVRLKDLKGDADTQAIFTALARQCRVRLERWETLMKELKASLD